MMEGGRRIRNRKDRIRKESTGSGLGITGSVTGKTELVQGKKDQVGEDSIRNREERARKGRDSVRR